MPPNVDILDFPMDLIWQQASAYTLFVIAVAFVVALVWLDRKDRARR